MQISPVSGKTAARTDGQFLNNMRETAAGVM
jgi:hypothetical protein